VRARVARARVCVYACFTYTCGTHIFFIYQSCSIVQRDLFVIQILLIDNDHSQLVTCGTVFQGTCQSRNLANISLNHVDVIRRRTVFVASTNPSNSAVALIASGPGNSVQLYVGTDDRPSTSDLYLSRKYTCGVTRRHLSGDGIFEISATTQYKDIGSFAVLSEAAATWPNFVVKYVAGFSVEQFSYFLTTQPAVYPPRSSTPQVSKLSQVCHQDKYFQSYVEMAITCSQPGGQDYSLVQAATVVQPGSRLASRLGLTNSSHLLVALFYGQSDSAVCVYQLSDIRSRFTDNIQACFDSSSMPLGEQFNARNCTATQVGEAADNQVVMNKLSKYTVHFIFSVLRCSCVNFNLVFSFFARQIFFSVISHSTQR